VVNGLNNLLNSYGNTIDINTPLNYRQGNEKAMNKFIDEAKSGSVKAVIFFDCNPVYNHVRGTELKSALSKISLKVSTSARPDETAILTDYIAPNHHYLESWGDVEPTPGYYSFIQPTISPIFDTRQAEESFLKWSGVNKPDYFNYLKDNWQEKSSTSNFDEFWDKCLYSGVYEEVPASVTAETVETEVSDDSPAGFNGNAASAANTIGKNYKGNGVELALYQKVGLGDGSQANNPWLQELPDPITKATWDNYLTVSQAWASENNFKMVDANTKMAKLTINQTSVEIPILIQPGQAPGTVGLAFGYGRTNAGKVANERGVNAFPLLSQINGTQSSYVLSNVSVEILDADYEIARTQTHQTYMGRENVIQESVLSEYIKDPSAGRRHAHVATWMEESGETNPGSLSLWKGHKFKNHHWGLAIDLNTCTGCSACVISCHAENNVPVVGKQEVINRRDMHWLRIDRYYSSDASPDDIKGLEKAAANPEVTFQPMMCQQCNNAPCETVCPVAATTHSSEGLNQMTYNRCIGTRYCANNCPYKVRRFNWFKYHDNSQFEDVNTAMNNDLGKMVLNPDVTVRSRGVMEKCSMCVQKIQQGKLQAKIEGRRPHDEDFDVACASSCPTEGMVFGDMNDPNSKISKLLKIKDTDQGDYITEKEIEEPRAFHVLEEIGVKPNVTYLTKIRNKDNA
ncbi:MAG: 4Fe-4S dicluster domain-containing protein, partial [Bacteroidota bacterium]